MTIEETLKELKEDIVSAIDWAVKNDQPNDYLFEKYPKIVEMCRKIRGKQEQDC